ncbi:hypothetical protein OVA24_14990 [Luteolibacter sp. SL250]|uniref:hypothetical protein n=1 Tax=Luteolibacter sp. SL250 TaxID=2995170 RepID=UPI002270EF49|nr:hypothetical protein [Luteolibacter sp. SL250]WAC18539.1 hypothetical protein OVA24_14990 [Luteolibacter sp. SL250]
MKQPESIEDMLSRLMPVAISEAGQRSLDAMLDELAGEEAAPEAPAAAPGGKSFWIYALPPVGIAAAAALAFLMPLGSSPREAVTSVLPEVEAPGIFLLGETDRIETLTDEGWLADPQGAAMQAVRVRVVEENTLRDEKTGIVFQISEPREELILTPVTAF